MGNITSKTKTEDIKNNRAAMISLLRLVCKKRTDLSMLSAFTRFSTEDAARLIDAERDKTFHYTFFLQDGADQVPASTDTIKLLDHAESDESFFESGIPDWMKDLGLGNDTYPDVFPKKGAKKKKKAAAPPPAEAASVPETVNGVATDHEKDVEKIREAFEGEVESGLQEPIAIPVEAQQPTPAEVVDLTPELDGLREALKTQGGVLQTVLENTAGAVTSSEISELKKSVESLENRLVDLTRAVQETAASSELREAAILGRLRWIKDFMTVGAGDDEWPCDAPQDQADDDAAPVEVAEPDIVEEEEEPAAEPTNGASAVLDGAKDAEELRERPEKMDLVPLKEIAVLEGVRDAEELRDRLKKMDLVPLKEMASNIGVPNARGMAYKLQVIREIVLAAFPA